eukprot:XP_001701399.1 predicted protein [Chlamydomonas reinhardtii]
MEPTLFLRLLPHLLRQQGRQGLIAFLDFEKAYNTVDLTFLSEAMEAAGAGPNLRGWVHTLLADTHLQRVAAVQYADDTKALLEGEQEVVAFLAAMHTFQHASGQRLNLSKVQLLRIGADLQLAVLATE